MYERLEQFEERKIFQRFGLSLTEFLDLPSDVCMTIMEIAGRKLKQEGSVMSSALDQINKMGG